MVILLGIVDVCFGLFCFTCVFFLGMVETMDDLMT